MSPILILLIGLLLIFLEFFLPGAILGISGGLMVLASLVLFIMEGHSALAVMLFILAAIAAVVFVCWGALTIVRRSKGAQTFFSDADQTGFVAAEYDRSAIGREGVALSDLKPSGHILVDGKHFQGLAQSGYIEKDSKIVVIGGQGAYLLVKTST